jgi:hypothetical protein
VRVERRRAVGAEDPQVLEPVVVADAVDVVEDQRHPRPAPLLVLAAELAALRLEPDVIQTLLELGAVVTAVLDEHLFERNRRARSLACPLASDFASIEVGRRDAPLPCVLPESSEVAPRRAQTERAQRLGHRPRARNGGFEFSAGEGAGHERMFAPPPRIARAKSCPVASNRGLSAEGWGARIRTRI